MDILASYQKHAGTRESSSTSQGLFLDVQHLYKSFYPSLNGPLAQIHSSAPRGPQNLQFFQEIITDRPTDQPSDRRPNNRPTNRETDRSDHREVTPPNITANDQTDSDFVLSAEYCSCCNVCERFMSWESIFGSKCRESDIFLQSYCLQMCVNISINDSFLPFFLHIFTSQVRPVTPAMLTHRQVFCSIKGLIILRRWSKNPFERSSKWDI